MPDFRLGRAAGAASIGELEIPHVNLLHTKTGPSKVRDAVAPPRPWTTFGSLSHGFSLQGLPHQSSIGHFGYMAELT